MRRTRLAAFAAAALTVAAMATGAAPASAFTNVTTGDAVSFTTTSFTVGNAFHCRAGTMNGQVWIDNGPGAGGTVPIGGPASLTNCQAFGGAATATLDASWGATLATFSAPLGATTLDLFLVEFAFGPGLSCLYEGSVSGTYQPTGHFDIAFGTFTLLQAVGSFCPVSPSASGVFQVKDAAGNAIVV